MKATFENVKPADGTWVVGVLVEQNGDRVEAVGRRESDGKLVAVSGPEGDLRARREISEREYLFTVELYPEQYQYTPPLPTEIPPVAEHDFSPSPKPGQLLLTRFSLENHVRMPPIL